MRPPLQQVRRGQRLEIPAGDWNAVLAAARAHQSAPAPAPAPGSMSGGGGGLVLVRNDSGADLARFGVLGVDAPIVAPADHASEFARRVALAGVTPAAAHVGSGRLVIAAAPIAAGKIGRAYAAGVCPARVDMADAADTTADAAEGSTVLASSGAGGGSGGGPLTILWAEGGTGEQWAVVRFGGGGGGEFRVALAQTGGADGNGASAATWTYRVDDLRGDQLLADADPTATPHVYRRANLGRTTPATAGTASYVDDGTGVRVLSLGWINEAPARKECAA